MAQKKSRGVYYIKNKRRWCVTFKVDGKNKGFGYFKSFENAVAKALEIWPTLAIAKRLQKTCKHCGATGKVGHQIIRYKTICKPCEKWERWIKKNLTAMRRQQRRDEYYTEWVGWAQTKQMILGNRKQAAQTVGKKPSMDNLLSWDQWVKTARQKTYAHKAHQQRIGWDRRCRTWAMSLQKRAEKQHRKMNCDN